MRRPWARAKPHDEIGLRLVIGRFQAHGYQNFLYGTETDSEALRRALQGQHDPTSIMLRFRPDQAFVKPGVRTVLCEVKTEGGQYPNFAIEADSYRAALLWNAAHRHVMFTFADLGAETLVACWAQDLPPPREIRVPRRWDFADNMERMRAEFPGVPLVPWPHKPGGAGSGTPYFLVPKRTRALTALDGFIVRDLSPVMEQLSLLDVGE